MSDIVKLYNPANAGTLTQEQIDGLQNLTSDEIKLLANAYPNNAFNRAYLLIVDKSKSPDKQLPSLATFQNLWNIRERNGLKNMVAWKFRDNHKPVSIPAKNIKAKRTEVVDLSETELLNLPGFKTADKTHEVQTVEVIKIKNKPGKKPKETTK